MVRFEISEIARDIMQADDEEEDEIRADVGDEEYDRALQEIENSDGYCAPACLACLSTVVPADSFRHDRPVDRDHRDVDEVPQQWLRRELVALDH